MKRKAWTMAELSISIIVLLLVTSASMSITKNININKSRIYMYAGMRNLSMGHMAIKEARSNQGFYPEAAKTHDEDAAKLDDWYCINLADAFSLKGSPNCKKSAAKTVTNMTLVNGVSYKGLANKWVEINEKHFYKDVLIDTDGDGGVNKIGIDQFPIRVFRGTNDAGQIVDGIINVVDCNNSYTKVDTMFETKSVYCTGVTNNIASDNTIVSHNIYRVTDGSKPKEATTIVAGLSTVEADCKAYGSEGFYGGDFCKTMGIKVLEACAHESTCKGCVEKGTCPEGLNEETCLAKAEENKLPVTQEDGTVTQTPFKCFTLMAKPTGGLGILGGALIGELGL